MRLSRIGSMHRDRLNIAAALQSKTLGQLNPRHAFEELQHFVFRVSALHQFLITVVSIWNERKIEPFDFLPEVGIAQGGKPINYLFNIIELSHGKSLANR